MYRAIQLSVIGLISALPSATLLTLPPQLKPEAKPVVQQKAGPDNRGTGYVPLTPERRAHFQAISKAKHGNRISFAAKNLALPAAFDCRVRSPLPIGDQGNCGSCYLYSTVRTMTDAGVMVGLGKPDGSFVLSSQYGMDRPRNFGGCDGGNGTEVIAWVVKNGWIAEKYIDAAGVVHNDYPAYEARSGNDRTKPGAKVWCKGWDWGFVSNSGTPTTEENKAAIFLHGRINVAVDAGDQFGNGTDTITRLGTNINHEINVVAYDDNKVNPDGTKGAFLLENQWGSTYGVGGCRWVTYVAAQNLVDHFWVSAGTIPPPPPPPVGGMPPFYLYQGMFPASVQVGTLTGYTTLVAAEVDARSIATSGKSAVYIYDSSKPAAVLIETVQPAAPVPPGGPVVITLTAEQVRSVLDQSGSLLITGETTLRQIADQLRKNQAKETKEPPK